MLRAAVAAVQVKYEILRAHLLDGVSVTAAAAAHGYSRLGFHLVAAAFEQAGMGGLLDDKRGCRGPVKLTAEIVEFCKPRRRPGPAPSWPRRSPTGSGWCCTGAPWNGPGGGERPCAGLARAPVLAGRGGGAGRLRGVAGARAGHRRAAGQPGRRQPDRRAVRPPRPARADRLAEPEPVFDAALLGAPWTPHNDPGSTYWPPDSPYCSTAAIPSEPAPAAPTGPLPDTVTDKISDRIKELPDEGRALRPGVHR